jgi:hypothetical protein
MLEEVARSVAIGLLSPQLTAFFTSAPILPSSAAVNSFSAKALECSFDTVALTVYIHGM